MELAAQEQVVVDQFAEVIRRHRACGLVALARLASIAFELSIGPKPSREDNLVLALAGGLEVRQHLAKAEGGSLSSKEVARHWASPRRRCCSGLKRVDWLRGGKEGGRPHDSHGGNSASTARFWLAWRRCSKSSIATSALTPGAESCFPWQTEGSLGNKRPLDLLREGRVNDVRMAAEAYVG